MIVQNSESLHDNPTNPPATTGQPGGLTASTAHACATGLPVAGLDLAAADRGADAADAADIAAEIVPNGSAEGRNRLADAITEPRTVTFSASSFSRDRATGQVSCPKDYKHGLTYGDRLIFEGQEFVVCDIDESYKFTTYVSLRNLDFKTPQDVNGNITFTVPSRIVKGGAL